MKNKLYLTLEIKNKLSNLEKLICTSFNIDCVFINSRKELYVVARSVFFHYAYHYLSINYLKLAAYSNMNNSSVYNSVQRFESYYNYYDYKCEIDYFTSLITSKTEK